MMERQVVDYQDVLEQLTDPLLDWSSIGIACEIGGMPFVMGISRSNERIF